jgi:hypothetical protein
VKIIEVEFNNEYSNGEEEVKVKMRELKEEKNIFEKDE